MPDAATLPADRLLITVAPTGAETAKEDCPQLPTTLDELVATAVECEAAGAAMIHVHIRDAEHRPTLDLARLTDTVAALREATSLVVQLSTGGSVHDPLERRLRVLDAQPDSCSLTMGTTNFGDDVFSNPWPFVCELYQLSQERQVVPEFELFDLGQVYALHRLLDQYGLPSGGKVHVRLRDGSAGRYARDRRRPGGRRVAALPEQVTSWSATGIGRSHPARRPGRAVQGREPARRYGGRAEPQPRASRCRPTASSWSGPPGWPRWPSAPR